MSKSKYDKESFIKEAKKIHKSRFDYSLVEYKTLYSSKIKIRCVEHDHVFEQIPKRHLQFIGCKFCSKSSKKTKEEFISQAMEIHGTKYNYEQFDYISNKIKGTIICNTCNNIWQVRPDSHLYLKSGCPKCVVSSIYTKEYYIKNNIPNHDCYLYLIELTNDTESFIKIGITKHSNIKYRFRGQLKDYNFNLMFFLKTDFYSAYEQEQKLHSKFKHYKYEPILNFKGHTECFKSEFKKEILLDFINLSH